jgi:hypothetical protein
MMRAASQVLERLHMLRELAGDPGWPDLRLPDITVWIKDAERFLRGD